MKDGTPIQYGYAVKKLKEGAGTYYQLSREGKETEDISFYRMKDDLYLIVKAEGSAFGYQYARVLENRIVTVRPTKEQMNEVAEKHKITLVDNLFLNGHELLHRRRGYIIDLAINLKASSTDADCSFTQ